jgi:hypothetical protein
MKISGHKTNYVFKRYDVEQAMERSSTRPRTAKRELSGARPN